MIQIHKIYIFIILAVLALPAISIEHYLNMEITKDDLKLCQKLKKGDSIIVQSIGGEIDVALYIATCVKIKKTKIKLSQGLSAAAFIVLASDNVCFISEHSVIGFHTPYKNTNGKLIGANIEELRTHLLVIMSLMKIWDYPQSDGYYVAGIISTNGTNSIGALEGKTLINLLGHRYHGLCKL